MACFLPFSLIRSPAARQRWSASQKSCESAFRNYFCIIKEPSLFSSLSLMKFSVEAHTHKLELLTNRKAHFGGETFVSTPLNMEMCSLNSRFLRVTAPGHVHLILELSGPGLPSRTYRTSEIQLCLRCSRKRLSVADVTHSPEGHCRTQMLPEQGQIMCHRCAAGGSRQISVCLGPFQRKRGFLSPDHIQTLDLMSTHLILNHTLSFCCSVTYM